MHVWGQGIYGNSLYLLPDKVCVCVCVRVRVCVYAQYNSLKTWFAHVYIRLSTGPRIKDRWHFIIMDSTLCIYKIRKSTFTISKYYAATTSK